MNVYVLVCNSHSLNFLLTSYSSCSSAQRSGDRWTHFFSPGDFVEVQVVKEKNQCGNNDDSRNVS